MTLVLVFLLKANKKTIICLISYVLGIIIPFTSAYFVTKPYNEYFDKESTITCCILSYPSVYDGYTRYDAQIIKDGKRCTGEISLYISNYIGNDLLDYGDVISVKNAKLKHYTKDNKTTSVNGKYASLSTKDYNVSIIQKNSLTGIKKHIFKLRDAITKNCDLYFNEEVSGFLKAITVGDKSSLSDKVNDDFKTSGLSHLIAISGFHLSVIVAFITYLFEGMKKSKRRIFDFVATVSICTLMIIITGVSLSVLRASIMLILASFSKLCFREYDSKTSILVAGGVIVLINPFSIFDVGFLLSYFATFGIVFLSPTISKWLNSKIKSKYLSDSVSITLSAQIMIFPILAIAFNTLQIFSFALNLLVVPVFSLLYLFVLTFIVISFIMPHFLTAVVGMNYILTKVIFFIASFGAKLPFSSIDVTGAYFVMDMLMIAAIILSSLVFFKTKKKIEKIVSIILVIALAISVFFIKRGENLLPNTNVSTNLKVSFLDVGQGDCALIQAGTKTVLIDGGSSSIEDIGKKKIKPYLLSSGVKKLDYIIVSHYHDDHYSGVPYLLDNFDVGVLVLSGASNSEDYKEKELLENSAKRNNVPIYYFFKDDAIKLNDETVLKVYSPLRGITYSSNDESLVIKLENPAASFLFTGDIEKSGENKLKSANLKTDVLKVAHHGSDSSSTENFLNNANPKYAVISCGKNNMYGHPHKEVTDRLKKRKIKYFRTDEAGDIVFTLDDNGKLYVNQE